MSDHCPRHPDGNGPAWCQDCHGVHPIGFTFWADEDLVDEEAAAPAPEEELEPLEELNELDDEFNDIAGAIRDQAVDAGLETGGAADDAARRPPPRRATGLEGFLGGPVNPAK